MLHIATELKGRDQRATVAFLSSELSEQLEGAIDWLVIAIGTQHIPHYDDSAAIPGQRDNMQESPSIAHPRDT